jgi:hypothetical protein
LSLGLWSLEGNGMSRSIRLILLTLVIVPTARADDADQIRKWVRALDDDRFEVRQEAGEHLRKAGAKAVPALEGGIGKSLEVTVRAFKILNDMAAGADLNAAGAAQDALERLAQSKDADIARRATELARARQERIVAVFLAAGAQLNTDGERIISLNFDNAKLAGLDLRPLRHLPDLEELSFSNPDAGDAVLEQLRGLRKLQRLNLYMSSIGDNGLKHLKTMPQLKWVPMGSTRITDAGLEHLKDLTQLEYVGLRANNITDAGLVHLKKLTNLSGLYLGETKVTDAGLAHLKGMTKMGYLRLHNVDVTDEGLKHLAGMKELRRLDLWETRTTDDGMAKLREAVPDVKIITTSTRR